MFWLFEFREYDITFTCLIKTSKLSSNEQPALHFIYYQVHSINYNSIFVPPSIILYLRVCISRLSFVLSPNAIILDVKHGDQSAKQCLFEVTANNESWIPLHYQCNELFILHFNTKKCTSIYLKDLYITYLTSFFFNRRWSNVVMLMPFVRL